MKPIFKPKNDKVYVPGHGVIDKADFTEVHLKACVRQVEAADIDIEEYLKKHMEISGFADLPLFGDDESDVEKKAKEKADKKAEAERKKAEAAAAKAEEERIAKEQSDEAELKRLMAEEEAAKEKQGEEQA
jgi:hypothetical protein